jgi:hypothetical protein
VVPYGKKGNIKNIFVLKGDSAGSYDHADPEDVFNSLWQDNI